MATAFQATNRYRSWLLVSLTNPSNAKQIAGQLYMDLGDPLKLLGKDPSFNFNVGDVVVIRVDYVKGASGFHLVIPVDTSSKPNMDTIRNYIETFAGVQSPVIEAHVEDHFPSAPYVSNGFISEDEANEGKTVHKIDPHDPDLGLTRKSPGDNPWG